MKYELQTTNGVSSAIPEGFDTGLSGFIQDFLAEERREEHDDTLVCGTILTGAYPGWTQTETPTTTHAQGSGVLFRDPDGTLRLAFSAIGQGAFVADVVIL